MSHWWTDKNFGNSRIEQVTLAELHRILDAAPAKRTRNEIILHHTWSPTAAQYKGRPTWAAIDGYHEKTRGWSDIGYHIGVAPNGTIWLLRPIQAAGAHCVNHNSYGIGVVMLGNYDKGKDDPKKVLPVAADVCAALCKRFNIPAGKIFGHRDFADKSCPGTAIDMAAFRKSVAATGASPAPQPSPTAKTIKLVDLMTGKTLAEVAPDLAALFVTHKPAPNGDHRADQAKLYLAKR
jgi:hypothetical protein